MVMKITETIEVGLGKATFKFNVLSDVGGIRLWLVDYRLKNGNKTLKCWRNFGDDGSFVKRESITIPDEVVVAAKAKISDSIQVEG
ncbi:hypothetical protein KW429_11755 [Vibrio fluvialis]|nr:hypothetical protein [Vibrio fluvialis]